jgi:REP element-mobilizing transposase RayT
LELDEFVIMPNHVHGIIVIQSDKVEESENNNHFPREKLYSNPSIVQPHRQIQQNGTVPGSIGAIIQNYKSVTTRKINAMPAMKNTKIWQVNYYDHIIRDEADHARIIEYIRENPAKWEQDELF